jgi:hypothetical protein
VSAESLDFKVAVLAVDGGCVAASEESPCDGELQAHHAITQQQLRRAGLDAYLWDPDVGAALCERHHRRHHSRREPVRLAALPERVFRFATRHGLVHVIERVYASEGWADA